MSCGIREQGIADVYERLIACDVGIGKSVAWLSPAGGYAFFWHFINADADNQPTMFSSLSTAAVAALIAYVHFDHVPPSLHLPEAIKRAAIASRSEKGSIAGARIGNTDHFIVYLSTSRGCGSGGCRAQVWKLEAGRPVRKGLTAVGRLPIVLLPEVDNGMPRIGITITNSVMQPAILPIAFDGQTYADDRYDNLLSQGSGSDLVSSKMLEPYQP